MLVTFKSGFILKSEVVELTSVEFQRNLIFCYLVTFKSEIWTESCSSYAEICILKWLNADWILVCWDSFTPWSSFLFVCVFFKHPNIPRWVCKWKGVNWSVAVPVERDCWYKTHSNPFILLCGSSDDRVQQSLSSSLPPLGRFSVSSLANSQVSSLSVLWLILRSKFSVKSSLNLSEFLVIFQSILSPVSNISHSVLSVFYVLCKIVLSGFCVSSQWILGSQSSLH